MARGHGHAVALATVAGGHLVMGQSSETIHPKRTAATKNADHPSSYTGADLPSLHSALIRFDRFSDIVPDALELMRVKGISHTHVRVRDHGLVLRVPRMNQFQLGAAENLAYQAASFERAAASGHTPILYAVIPQQDGIANGAFVVEEILGEPPALPADMPSIAEALAAIHLLPVPAPMARPPLAVHTDPVAGTLGFIEAQAVYLPVAGLADDARRQVEDELAWARRFAADAAGQDHPLTFVGTDTHPGNFLKEPEGRAVFVDLEKGLYGSPAVDLAHASLYTSTMWDPDCATVIDHSDVAEFYQRYFDLVPADLAARLRPWLSSMRRLTWLRTTTWCARWRVEAAKPPADAADTSSETTSVWSAARLEPTLAHYVRARIADYFSPDTIAHIRREWLGPNRLDL